MGLFDEVYTTCDCGGNVSWQSKAGECVMSSYHIDSVPVAIADDVDGMGAQCEKCYKQHWVHFTRHSHIHMTVEKEED